MTKKKKKYLLICGGIIVADFGCATIYPRFWDIDSSPHGFRKCFYLNPIPQLNNAK